MPILQPAKGWLQGTTVAGYDMTRHVLKLSCFETICKPYLTGTLILQDDQNVINTLNLVGGEPISFSFSGCSGKDYAQTLYLLSMQGEPSSNNLRSVRYTMQLIGPEYFGDKANMVQKAYQGTPGTSIASDIHSMFLGGGLGTPVPSTGMLGEKNSWQTHSAKPIKAINDVRKIMTFAGMSGANLYYHDRSQAWLVPVEYLFSSLSQDQSFEQRNTWGSDWQNIFGGYNAILAASTTINDAQGRGGVKFMSSMSQAERKLTDIFSSKKVFDDAIKGGGFGGVISSIAGGHGGEHNFPTFMSDVIPKQNVRDTGADRAYTAGLIAGPQVTIKVPFQTGVYCTAGRGCNIKLAPPSGDIASATLTDYVSGPALIADLCHEIEVGDQDVAATTTMRCVRKQ